jgi:hypothetical protein
MCRQAKENLKDASMDGESSLPTSASCAARMPVGLGLQSSEGPGEKTKCLLEYQCPSACFSACI